MDITNNVSIINGDIGQIGGTNVITDIESSDYDLNTTEFESSFTDNDINEILFGGDVDFDTKNFNVADLNKNSTFNKLTNNQKTLVINRLLEKIPKNLKQNKSDSSIIKESYFYCKTCGYYEKIPNKQFIFSRGDEKKDDTYNTKFNQYKHDNTLPYSKKYVCINEKCSTHENPKIKMAVFFRIKGSYNIKYICTICDSMWNTFVEK